MHNAKANEASTFLYVLRAGRQPGRGLEQRANEGGIGDGSDVDAGIAFKGNVFGAEEARTTMATNFGGTRAVCERIAPLMPKGGRIVNVCSGAGGFFPRHLAAVALSGGGACGARQHTCSRAHAIASTPACWLACGVRSHMTAATCAWLRGCQVHRACFVGVNEHG